MPGILNRRISIHPQAYHGSRRHRPRACADGEALSVETSVTGRSGRRRRSRQGAASGVAPASRLAHGLREDDPWEGTGLSTYSRLDLAQAPMTLLRAAVPRARPVDLKRTYD